MRPLKSKRRRVKAPPPPNGNANGGETAGGGDGGKEEESENGRILECDYLSFSFEVAENGSYPSTSAGSSSYFDSNTEDPKSSLSSSSYDGKRFPESELVQVPNGGKGFPGSKPKRVVASTGVVSSVITGKDYGQNRRYGYGNAKEDVEEMEQFLCSKFGEECQLSLAVVRDVLCHCGYDVEKALDALLELSASSHSKFKDCSSDNFSPNNGPDSGHDCKKYSEILVGSPKRSSSSPGIKETCLPQKVLESLFTVPKSSEQDLNSINWQKIVKKMESFGPGFSVRADSASEQKNIEFVAAKGTEYQVFRKAATEHYDAMKSYYQKAATAFSRGDRGYAAYLSDQGRVHNKIARKADEKASQDIFETRNKGVQNVVTIDLHGQHVKQAVRILKVHLLLFTTYISSVQFLRVITGCGAHGVGQGKLKQTVIDIVKKTSMEWGEENRGTLMIKIDSQSDLTWICS